MTILVTGGAGFIGGKLVKQLLARGEEVRVLDLRVEEASLLADAGAKLFVGDILNRADVGAAMEGCERVFHAAALFEMWQLDKSRYHRVNVEGTWTVLGIALEKRVRRVVYTSSAVTIGEADGEPGTENTVHRGYFLSEYERSKYLAEQVAFEMCERGLPVVVVNPTSVYGPGQIVHLTGAISRFLRGDLPVVVDVELNLAYIDDVVRGHIAALENAEIGQRYILGGENTSLAELLSLAAELAGAPRKPHSVPSWVVRSAALALAAISKITGRRPLVSPDEARTASHSFIMDTRKAQEELGLEWTPLRVGMERTVSWLRRERLMADAGV